jgi:hypothetical protein
MKAFAWKILVLSEYCEWIRKERRTESLFFAMNDKIDNWTSHDTILSLEISIYDSEWIAVKTLVLQQPTQAENRLKLMWWEMNFGSPGSAGIKIVILHIFYLGIQEGHQTFSLLCRSVMVYELSLQNTNGKGIHNRKDWTVLRVPIVVHNIVMWYDGD